MTQVPFGQIAPISRRAIGYLIDALVAGGLATVLTILVVISANLTGSVEGAVGVLAIGLPLVSLVLLGWFVFYTFMQAGAGSIGMRSQGLRLIAEDGSPLGFGRTLLRNVTFGLAAGIVVGYFTPLFDGSGRFQGWHDKVAKSLMLDARGADAADRAQPMNAAGAQAPAPVRGFAAPGVPFTPGMTEAPHAPATQAFTAIPGIPAPHSAPATPFGAPPVPQTPPFGADAPVMPHAPAPAATPASWPAAAPGVPAVPGAPEAPAAEPAYPAPAYAAPDAAPAYAAPAPAAAPAAPPAPAEQAPLATTPAAPADDDGLIAYVPGITLDAPPQRSVPDAAPTEHAAPTEQPSSVEPVAPAQWVVPERPAAPAFPVVPPAPAFTAAPADELAAPATAAPDAASSAEPALSADSVDDDLEETRISIPGHRLVFTWDDGTRVTVSRRTVFGRNPAPEDGAIIVPVRDETLSLSKTHFEAAASTSGGWVLDRFSTNGMTLVREGQRIACPAGQRVPVRLGDAIEIGDRIVTIGGYA
ncbi:RDD family protein [Microbacterium sp. 22215]|uniref:RDD family protein n=1 Tax=Microbacterium sp. 22215 TaxID=3453893 RepID=UPI003F86AE40